MMIYEHEIKITKKKNLSRLIVWNINLGIIHEIILKYYKYI